METANVNANGVETVNQTETAKGKERKSRGESELSKGVKEEISLLTPDQQKAELLKFIEESPERISSLLYFSKMWSTKADPEMKIWENLSKDLRSAQMMEKRSGVSGFTQAIIKDLEVKLQPLNTKYGVYPSLQN
jgi:hypothetical protein